MNNTICITGHRPIKLGGGYDWDTPKNNNIREYLYRTFEKEIIENNIKRYITGGALGTDVFAMYVLIRHKELCFHDLELVLALPFTKQPNKCPAIEKRRYEHFKKWA